MSWCRPSWSSFEAVRLTHLRETCILILVSRNRYVFHGSFFIVHLFTLTFFVAKQPFHESRLRLFEISFKQSVSSLGPLWGENSKYKCSDLTITLSNLNTLETFFPLKLLFKCNPFFPARPTCNQQCVLHFYILDSSLVITSGFVGILSYSDCFVPNINMYTLWGYEIFSFKLLCVWEASYYSSAVFCS